MPYDRGKETRVKVLHDVTAYLVTAQTTSNLLFHLNSGCNQKHLFDAAKIMAVAQISKQRFLITGR